MTARPPRRRAHSGRLVVRAIAWRSGSSLAYFLVAVVCIMAATAGPIEVRAADQSLVTTRLDGAAVATRGLSLIPTNGYLPPGRLLDLAATVPGGVRYGSPILTIDSSALVLNPSSGTFDGIDLVSRSGACTELHFTTGHCPRAPAGVAISTRTAAELRLEMGSVLRTAAPDPMALTVSGIYQVPPASLGAWWGSNYFPFGASYGPSGELLDDGFVTRAGALVASGRLPTSDYVQLPLDVSSVAAPDAPRVLSQLSSWSKTLSQRDRVAAGTQLSRVLDSASTEERIAGIIAEMVTLELVLLALLVLYGVAGATSAVRGSDVRLAQLRGLSRRRVTSLALGEPVALLLVALPVGIAASLAACLGIDRALFGAAERTGLDSLSIVTAICAAVAGLLATVIASRAFLVARRADDSSPRSSRAQATKRATLDAVGVALGVAGLTNLLSQNGHAASSSASTITYLGPGLIALGVAVLAVRLVPLLGTLAVRFTRWSRRVGSVLAATSLARRSPVRRQVLVVSIAAALAVFAAAALDVAEHNREVQADYLLGAPVVLHVDLAPGTNLLSAVRSADESGKEAMAVAISRASFGTTIALDPTRLAAIAAWAPDVSKKSVRAVASTLDPKSPPERTVAGGKDLVLSATVRSALRPRPALTATLYDPVVGSSDTVDFGRLEPGTHDYTGPLLGSCTDGCRLDSFSLSWSGSGAPAAATHYEVELGSLGTATGTRVTPAAMDFTRTAAWRAGSGMSEQATPAGLELSADLASGVATLSARDLPRTLPVVATRDLESLDTSPGTPLSVSLVGLDGTELTGKPVATTSILPSVGDNASMVNLAFSEREEEGAAVNTTFEVWCARPPSARLLSALDSRGVRVVSTDLASAQAGRLGRSGPAFGFDLYGISAIAALILALGWLAFSIASQARSRRVELAGLVAVGVPRRSCGRALVLESSFAVLAATIAGVVAGYVGALLALRWLPEFAPGRVGPPLDFSVPIGLVIATGAIVLVVLELASVVANSLLLRGVRPRLLWSTE